MNKASIIWLIVAAALIVSGGLAFVGAMAAAEWDFSKLSANKYETNRYEIGEAFAAISVETDTADIAFVPAADGTCRVVCEEWENAKHTVSVQDGVLQVKVEDNRKWYEYIGFHFRSPKITVYLPEGEYGALSVKSDTGKVAIPEDFRFESIAVSERTGDVLCRASADGGIRITATTGRVRVEGVTADSLFVEVSTGDVAVKDVVCDGDVTVNVTTGDTDIVKTTCNNLYSDGSTGDLTLEDVIAAGSFSLERSTGDVEFERCDAAALFVETDTGDVEGSLLSEKVFITETDTGHVRVPSSASGGRCEITTDTGDIRITVK